MREDGYEGSKQVDHLHRNNAAEWVMVVVLCPVALVVHLVSFVRSFATSRLRG